MRVNRKMPGPAKRRGKQNPEEMPSRQTPSKMLYMLIVAVK